VRVYPQADFDADIEERPVDDPRQAATWGPRIFRVVLAAKRPASQGHCSPGDNPSARVPIGGARALKRGRGNQLFAAGELSRSVAAAACGLGL
jgi:hypothetical protein